MRRHAVFQECACPFVLAFGSTPPLDIYGIEGRLLTSMRRPLYNCITSKRKDGFEIVMHRSSPRAMYRLSSRTSPLGPLLYPSTLICLGLSSNDPCPDHGMIALTELHDQDPCDHSPLMIDRRVELPLLCLSDSHWCLQSPGQRLVMSNIAHR